MRVVQLTRHPQRRAAAAAPRDPARVGIYACGPTVYSRIHIGNARPFVIFSLLKRFLEHEGYGVQLVDQRHRRQRQDLRRRARAGPSRAPSWPSEMTRLYVADTDALGLGRPDHEPLASETIEPIVAHDRGAGRARPRLCGRRRRLLPRALRSRLRHALAPPTRRHGPGRGRRGLRAQGGPARLRAVEGAQGGRGHRAGTRRGGPGGPAGTSSARRWPSSCSASASTSTAAARPRLPPSRERDRADARGARQRAGAAVDAQRHDPGHRREDGEVGRQHRAAAEVLERYGARGRRDVPDLRPLSPAAGRLADAPDVRRAPARAPPREKASGWR